MTVLSHSATIQCEAINTLDKSNVNSIPRTPFSAADAVAMDCDMKKNGNTVLSNFVPFEHPTYLIAAVVVVCESNCGWISDVHHEHFFSILRRRSFVSKCAGTSTVEFDSNDWLCFNVDKSAARKMESRKLHRTAFVLICTWWNRCVSNSMADSSW